MITDEQKVAFRGALEAVYSALDNLETTAQAIPDLYEWADGVLKDEESSEEDEGLAMEIFNIADNLRERGRDLILSSGEVEEGS